jgi:hypothetical protein
MRRSLRSWSAALAVISVVPLALSTPGGAAPSSRATCHVPRMTGLTVKAARSRARVAGCQLRLTGAAVKIATVQTVRTQSVPPGRSARSVSVAVNPLCTGPAGLGPPPGEPIEKPGATELVTGLFVEGGPLVFRSAPNCEALVGKSTSGTITVVNSVGTVLANNMAVSAGQLLYVNVQPGTYTVSGKLSGGTAIGPITVTVPSGEIVRQDLVLQAP